ncbi:hypothetical protein Aperf_G00000069679 [Anoplocephala perfoliata]
MSWLSFKSGRKTIRPLRPWVSGLDVPDVVSELADIVPFIYLCCKFSSTEHSWAHKPQDPKAVIVKDEKSLKLSDGQFWIDLKVDDSLQSLLECGNRFRSRDVCFFIVFLSEYVIAYNFGLGRFVASVNGLTKIKETHSLEEAFESIPSINTVERKVVNVNASSSSKENESPSCQDNVNENSREDLGGSHENLPSSGNVDCVQAEEQISSVGAWIPTQNASEGTFSYTTENNGNGASATVDLDCATHRVPPTPQKMASSLIDGSPITPNYSPIAIDSRYLSELGSEDITSMHEICCSSLPERSTNLSSFLSWLSRLRPTAEIRYLEETARYLDELHKIAPTEPFSDYFDNFAFSD